jgi:hypothetical protein
MSLLYYALTNSAIAITKDASKYRCFASSDCIRQQRAAKTRVNRSYDKAIECAATSARRGTTHHHTLSEATAIRRRAPAACAHLFNMSGGWWPPESMHTMFIRAHESVPDFAFTITPVALSKLWQVLLQRRTVPECTYKFHWKRLPVSGPLLLPIRCGSGRRGHH